MSSGQGHGLALEWWQMMFVVVIRHLIEIPAVDEMTASGTLHEVLAFGLRDPPGGPADGDTLG